MERRDSARRTEQGLRSRPTRRLCLSWNSSRSSCLRERASRPRSPRRRVSRRIDVRWLIVIGIAALAVAFLYLGVLAPMFSLFRQARHGSADAPAAPLAVESSKIAP